MQWKPGTHQLYNRVQVQSSDLLPPSSGSQLYQWAGQGKEPTCTVALGWLIPMYFNASQ